jgi:6-phosphogluconolactonase
MAGIGLHYLLLKLWYQDLFIAINFIEKIMQLHIFKTADELSTALAEWIITYINDVLRRKDNFTIVLSGGSTPRKLHQVLASHPYRDRINWEKLHFFWGDERVVPFEDDRNNAKMAFDTLLNLVPVNQSNIHRMRTDIAPEASAHQYEKLLHEYFDNKPASFDLVLLGMGDDGHTLSLFPGTEVVEEKTAWVKAFYLDAQTMYRITLTAPIVNKSAAVIFLTTGKNKAATLKQVLEGPLNPKTYPCQLIRPEHGSLDWFVDEAAASELKKIHESGTS